MARRQISCRARFIRRCGLNVSPGDVLSLNDDIDDVVRRTLGHFECTSTGLDCQVERAPATTETVLDHLDDCQRPVSVEHIALTD